MANAFIIQITLLFKSWFLLHSYLLCRIQSGVWPVNTHLFMKFSLYFCCILFPEKATTFNLGEQNIFKQFHYRCSHEILVYLSFELPSHKTPPDFIVSQKTGRPTCLLPFSPPESFAFFLPFPSLLLPLVLFLFLFLFSPLNFPISSFFSLFPLCHFLDWNSMHRIVNLIPVLFILWIFKIIIQVVPPVWC